MDKVTRALIAAKMAQESEKSNSLWRFIDGSEEEKRKKEMINMESRHRKREKEREKERSKYKKKYDIHRHEGTRSSDSEGGHSRPLFGAKLTIPRETGPREKEEQNAKRKLESERLRDTIGEKYFTGSRSKVQSDQIKREDNIGEHENRRTGASCCWCCFV